MATLKGKGLIVGELRFRRRIQNQGFYVIKITIRLQHGGGAYRSKNGSQQALSKIRLFYITFLLIPALTLENVKTLTTIAYSLLLLCLAPQKSSAQPGTGTVDFFGVSIALPRPALHGGSDAPLSKASVQQFIGTMDNAGLQTCLQALMRYKEQFRPDDWLYYQLVRKVAQHISPKADNYYRYTFYKWWLLTQSGYHARLLISGNYLLFYVQSDEVIYNIPSRQVDGRQFVCLNYHDYGTIDFDRHRFEDVTPAAPGALQPFSYKVHQLPDFNPADYAEKEVQFTNGLDQYSFRIKINPQVKSIFTNYPVVDYDLQFNMPLSRPTYESLIPSLKKELKRLSQKDGVAFLMRFTRYAFLFKPDTEAFGAEKRLTPEQTLLYEFSDCEDRAALFFFLVKEIYNLPMLVLTYPKHVTVAVEFDKPYGKTIEHEGIKYTVCEPSPQKIDLQVGQLLPELKKQPYQVAFAYRPAAR